MFIYSFFNAGITVRTRNGRDTTLSCFSGTVTPSCWHVVYPHSGSAQSAVHGRGACLRSDGRPVNSVLTTQKNTPTVKMDELTQLLHRFSVEVVEASRQVSRDAIAYCMNAVIQPILSSMARADARFKCYVPLPTEQYFEAMKVSASDEFELIVVLDNLVQMKSFRDVSGVSPELSCYGEVTFTNSFANAMWAADMCVAGRHGPQSFLSAAKIRQYFAKLVTVIAADLFNNGTAVQVSFKGTVSQSCYAHWLTCLH